jgi:hypothetical protein
VFLGTPFFCTAWRTISYSAGMKSVALSCAYSTATMRVIAFNCTQSQFQMLTMELGGAGPEHIGKTVIPEIRPARDGACSSLTSNMLYCFLWRNSNILRILSYTSRGQNICAQLFAVKVRNRKRRSRSLIICSTNTRTNKDSRLEARRFIVKVWTAVNRTN